MFVDGPPCEIYEVSSLLMVHRLHREKQALGNNKETEVRQ